ncbi:mandelate racemase [Schaalia hyovaginalis]|uniref:Succinate-acetate transporter protein n=1 Tax=Schaalia hyovaginalis TaxID=29316 RepID=A0A923E4B2_9ACTO|nr:mandelate racemase [Schaalia hyovaginalis]MBB6334137.1 succinate-acetate transporter protein [Schaalia hyovaginalis]
MSAPAISSHKTIEVPVAKTTDFRMFIAIMTVLALVIGIVAATGAITGSPLLLISAGLAGTIASLFGVYTGVTIAANN